ncbi:acyltransferase family protein [Clostridium pasteurianum]|uniref:Putative acyltransferase n=1 Tax=Clostridium pasteurianum BC1 TaxID=86416 RepID=R4K5S7_CLOPA|nr:acyltransferase [Clostridium pasteurianum]AGK95899.1 putative acyltransferase [Clostridium pasteurianum BC1]
MNKKELTVYSGIAILFVVLIHSNSYFMNNVINVKAVEKAPFIVRLLDYYIKGAVSMFIFIAGYKYALRDLNTDYNVYIKKRLTKVIKPFLIISIIFIIFDTIGNFNNFNLILIIKQFIKIFLGYNVVYQLWYIPLYILIITSYPLIYRYIKSDKVRIMIFVFISLIIRGAGLKYSILTSYPIVFLCSYLLFEMGVLFCKHNIEEKIKNKDLFILFYIVLVLCFAIAPIPSKISVPLQYFLLWTTGSIAYYLISLKLKNNRILNLLGKYSFYIFLFHEPIIGKFISKYFISINIDNFFLLVIGRCILDIIITLLLYKIIQKTFLNKLIL